MWEILCIYRSGHQLGNEESGCGKYCIYIGLATEWEILHIYSLATRGRQRSVPESKPETWWPGPGLGGGGGRLAVDWMCWEGGQLRMEHGFLLEELGN